MVDILTRLTPHRVGKRIVHELLIFKRKRGPALKIQGAVAAEPETWARLSRIGEDLAPSLGSYHK